MGWGRKGGLGHETDGVWFPCWEPTGYRRREDRDTPPGDTGRSMAHAGTGLGAIQAAQPSSECRGVLPVDSGLLACPGAILASLLFSHGPLSLQAGAGHLG